MTSENTRRARNIQPAPSAASAVKQKGSTATKTIVAVISALILAVSGVGYATVGRLDTGMSSASDLSLGEDGLSDPSLDGAADILLVGKDSRTDAQGNPLSEKELAQLHSADEVATNTDTILLIRIPDDGSSATAISIPRDSYVDVPGVGMSKINAAYGTTRETGRAQAVTDGKSEGEAESEGTLAGRKALVDTVANLTGVQVDHYAEVGLLGFVLLTDAVGGVESAPARGLNQRRLCVVKPEPTMSVPWSRSGASARPSWTSWCGSSVGIDICRTGTSASGNISTSGT